jgi:hypothetical protein
MSMESFLCHIQCLLILRELVLFPQLRLLFFVQTGEICLPPWAEVNVPARPMVACQSKNARSGPSVTWDSSRKVLSIYNSHMVVP